MAEHSHPSSLHWKSWSLFVIEHRSNFPSRTSSFQHCSNLSNLGPTVFGIVRTSRSWGNHLCWKFAKIPNVEGAPTIKVPSSFLLLTLAYPSGMLFLTIFGEVMFQFSQINWKCVFILIKSHWRRCLKLAFFGLFIYVKSVKTVPSGKAMIEKFRADKLSTFLKSEAFSFSSANFIEFIQKRCVALLSL